MSFLSEYAAAGLSAKVDEIGANLVNMREISDGLTSGTTKVRDIIQSARRLDAVYNATVPLWTSPEVAAIRTTAENQAVGSVKTALDDLFLTFADHVAAASLDQAIDIGAGYNPAAGRGAKLAAIDRGFSDSDITVPTTIATAATTLRDAIDTFLAG